MDNKKIVNKRNLLISVSVVVLLVVGLVLMGYLAVTWKQPQQQVVLVTRVCGDDIVKRFNTIDDDGFKKLVTDIKSNSNYQSDATCQTILLAAAIHDQNYSAAKDALAAVKALQVQHIYVDSNLNTGSSLSDFEASVQELSPSNQGNNQEPKGGA